MKKFVVRPLFPTMSEIELTRVRIRMTKTEV